MVYGAGAAYRRSIWIAINHRALDVRYSRHFCCKATLDVTEQSSAWVSDLYAVDCTLTRYILCPLHSQSGLRLIIILINRTRPWLNVYKAHKWKQKKTTKRHMSFVCHFFHLWSFFVKCSIEVFIFCKFCKSALLSFSRAISASGFY